MLATTITIAAFCLIKPLNINIDSANSKKPSKSNERPDALAKRSLSTFEFSFYPANNSTNLNFHSIVPIIISVSPANSDAYDIIYLLFKTKSIYSICEIKRNYFAQWRMFRSEA